jgi:hypothetical protein
MGAFSPAAIGWSNAAGSNQFKSHRNRTVDGGAQMRESL